MIPIQMQSTLMAILAQQAEKTVAVLSKMVLSFFASLKLIDNGSNAAIRIEQDAVVSGTITNVAGGTILGARNAINVNGAHSAHNLTITNAGTIEGTSGDGIVITGAGVTLNNQAGGVITGGDAGVQVASTAITVDIGPSNVEDFEVLAINNTFTNAGTISGGRASFDASGAGEAITFTQQGGSLIGWCANH